MTQDILEALNARQKEAVETIEGPLLIIAGPGSGKTRVITHRIAYLVKVCGVRPYGIAAVTFTNKAAREMRERVDALMGPSSRDLTVGTFHAFCAMLLRRAGDNLGLDRNFAIYDDADQLSAIKRAMKEVEVDAKQYAPRAIQSAISSAKSQLLDAEGFHIKAESYWEEIVFRVYERYEQLLSQSSALDFDDLLLSTYRLLKEFPDVASRYQGRYVHFMIDEFQDTNVAQYAIAKQLSEKYRNLCVVGDPDQSIYSWRNADIRNILSFQRDFPDARTIVLDENYRSTQTILDAAHGLIEANEQRADVEKDLFTRNGRGSPIVVSEAFREQDEANDVVKEIERLARDEGYSRSDFAVMYRVNAQSRALEETCARYGVPYQLVGGLRFYQRQEVKDLAAYLRLVANPHDDASFARVANVPVRGIGQRTLDGLTSLATAGDASMYATVAEIAQKSKDGAAGPLPARSARALIGFCQLIDGLAEARDTMELPELIDLVLERSGYQKHVLEADERGQERLENLQEFSTSAKHFLELGGGDSLVSFLERVSLASDVDTMDERADAITLITLHQAKGLEFPVVFIVGMEEGILPHARSMDNDAELEEERRLCYVGVTRAKERLYLHRVFRRGFRGGSGPSPASRFLSDIPPNLVTSAPALEQEQPRSLGRLSRRIGRAVATPPTEAARPSRPRDGRVGQGAQLARNRATRKTESPAPTMATGDKVRHAMFGEGIVTTTRPSGDDLEVTVAFAEGGGVKRLLLSFAPLEKVK